MDAGSACWQNYIEQRLDIIESYLENTPKFAPHIKKKVVAE